MRSYASLGVIDVRLARVVRRKISVPKPLAAVIANQRICAPLALDVDVRLLLVLFVGLNPGITTAQTGYAYAHPSNLFWKLLHSSGVTPRLVPPHEDKRMPSEYSLGLTNIVARPSRNGAELSKAEMDAGVEVLGEKAKACKAEVVCFVGKSIWESVWRVRKGRGIKKEEFKYGWQDEGENYPPEGDWAGAKVFVASSTSGLAATLSPAEKEAIWRELGVWVERRRAERAAEAEAPTRST